MRHFLIIDEHDIVRRGVKTMLLNLFDPAEISEAFDEVSATGQLAKKSFDLVLIDIHMPNTDAIRLMEFIHAIYPDIRVLVFSMSAENIYAKRFLEAGACGFVSKEALLGEIQKAITLVLDGKLYFSDALMEMVAHKFPVQYADNPFSKLSAREHEIVSLFLKGDTLSEIVKSLKIKVSTAGTHKSGLFEKLEVKNILELKELATFYNY